MGRALWGLLRVIALLAIIAATFVYLGPVERVERGEVARVDLDDPAGWLAAREARFDDITEGAEAQILWAGEAGAASDVVVLYLHGFSATSQEIRPVPDRVAEALGANLILARLPGHGRDGAAMAEPRAGDWLDETEAMLRLARGIGERVVVMGTSTGGTLASWAASDPEMAEDVAAMVLISPNYALANPAGVLVEWPLARVWAPWVAGAERSFEPINDGHGRYWTTAYPTEATVTLGTLLREIRARDFSDVTVPALFMFADTDRVISASAVREFSAQWGGDATLMPVAVPEEGGDPFHHVIAGDILSPALTERVVRDVTDWLREVLY
ncbi:alpha/beta hydrolase [Gymnodinialimonas ceratoperidinii]|uniref:Alpha/beta fold hydrolase n=1 Tax=Gymnodinialimonas ceratoperidinii TaxID=2856823 RepID=A0A8F6TWJ2_9RHOB|nr:alpha/beta fold hydrolase [Gymnodinialimonas ceratoperidinii]QXT39224.1 alpha/beta fold hydrolase [Gymnodinialimonas ceratoperidinii]